jgi:hypothetical protein
MKQQLKHTTMKKFTGKDEKINGTWYPVTVQADNLKEAIKKLYVGQKKSYGTVCIEKKLIKVLEHFLSLHEVDEIFNMINDPQFEIEDVERMLENYEDENYTNPNE